MHEKGGKYAVGTLFQKGSKKSKDTLLIIYKLRLEDLFNQDNEYRVSEFIEKKVNPIYEKYPYAQVCIEVNC